MSPPERIEPCPNSLLGIPDEECPETSDLGPLGRLAVLRQSLAAQDWTGDPAEVIAVALQRRALEVVGRKAATVERNVNKVAERKAAEKAERLRRKRIKAAVRENNHRLEIERRRAERKAALRALYDQALAGPPRPVPGENVKPRPVPGQDVMTRPVPQPIGEAQ